MKVDAYLEIIILGIRDMATFHFLPMQQPYLEIEMNCFGTKTIMKTEKSKRYV